jgi:hypothetical protein
MPERYTKQEEIKMKMKVTIESVVFIVELIDDEPTPAPVPTPEIDPNQGSLSDYMPKPPTPPPTPAVDTHRGPNSGVRSDKGKNHHCSACGTPGRKALKRLNGHCFDCATAFELGAPEWTSWGA